MQLLPHTNRIRCHQISSSIQQSPQVAMHSSLILSPMAPSVVQYRLNKAQFFPESWLASVLKVSVHSLPASLFVANTGAFFTCFIAFLLPWFFSFSIWAADNFVWRLSWICWLSDLELNIVIARCLLTCTNSQEIAFAWLQRISLENLHHFVYILVKFWSGCLHLLYLSIYVDWIVIDLCRGQNVHSAGWNSRLAWQYLWVGTTVPLCLNWWKLVQLQSYQ